MTLKISDKDLMAINVDLLVGVNRHLAVVSITLPLLVPRNLVQIPSSF